MPGIDDKRQFIPLKIAVLTVSDTRQLADDRSGDVRPESEVGLRRIAEGSREDDAGEEHRAEREEARRAKAP